MKSLIVTLVFTAVIVSASTPKASAQHKSPAAAGLMSLVLPGTGQFYTHQQPKGWVLLGTYGAALGLVVAYGPWTWEKASSGEFADLNPGTSSTTKMIWYGSAAVAGGVLIYSVADAIGAANKLNSGKLSLVPYTTGGARGLCIRLKTNW
jgi:TM2 domain-containing membrane protein YozV